MRFAARSFANLGAWIMGRNMFGPVRGLHRGSDAPGGGAIVRSARLGWRVSRTREPTGGCELRALTDQRNGHQDIRKRPWNISNINNVFNDIRYDTYR
jgi:dihydrofolate reductase